MSQQDTQTPDQNPSPSNTDHQSLKPCVVCENYPVNDQPTLTSNHGLYNVNRKHTIDPLCEDHDTEPVDEVVQKTYDYAGVNFVAEAIKRGVFGLEDARAQLPESVMEDIENAL